MIIAEHSFNLDSLVIRTEASRTFYAMELDLIWVQSPVNTSLVTFRPPILLLHKSSGCVAVLQMEHATKMAPNLSLSKIQLICDVTSSGMSISKTADVAECSKQAVKYIRSNLRVFGSPRAPPTRVGRTLYVVIAPKTIMASIHLELVPSLSALQPMRGLVLGKAAADRPSRMITNDMRFGPRPVMSNPQPLSDGFGWSHRLDFLGKGKEMTFRC